MCTILCFKMLESFFKYVYAILGVQDIEAYIDSIRKATMIILYYFAPQKY